MADPDPALTWELRHARSAGVLDNEELVVEIEAAMLGWSPGALIVTDKQVLFVNTGVFRRKPKVLSVALGSVNEARSAAVWGMRDRGELTLAVVDENGSRQLEFEQIHGGLSRATEIAESILRERDRLVERSESGREAPPDG